jgi:hypothetical protein
MTAGNGIVDRGADGIGLKHDPEKWIPVFDGERMRSQIMLKQ